MGKIVQITLKFNESLDLYLEKHFPQMDSFRILSESLDPRGAPKGMIPKKHYRVEISEPGHGFLVKEESYPSLKEKFSQRPIIIGAGPAGLYCALRFLEYGIPTLIFERGDPALERMKSIAKFWRYGEFNPESNVCYGEGGAGLYSDGKLMSRVKSEYISYVMKKLVEFGAPKDTEYKANPHLGSNKIRGLISSMSESLKNRGCDILYNTRVDELIFENGNVTGVLTSKGEKHYSSHVILAIGHSPLSFFEYLHQSKVKLTPKNFALGVRIEHPREMIDRSQFGDFCIQGLESATYRLSYYDEENQKGTYSFCMCPGGHVLSSGTEENGHVTNGMSNQARNSPWSNSALVVSVDVSRDLEGDHPLRGFYFQKEIERKAFDLSKKLQSGKELCALSVEEFLKEELNDKPLPPSSCPSKLVKVDLKEIFPSFILRELKRGIQNFNQKIKGFIDPRAVLIAPETRTSCPVRIDRDPETLESESHQGLFPCGEGAGYAGGITSAAVDGVKVAEAIIKSIS